MYWNNAPFSVCSNCKFRLTLTWDVLKFDYNLSVFDEYAGLTLTWDVLKWKKLIEVNQLLID